jgi:pyruvate kinase
VFRLNMSHGGHDEIRVRHATIRKVEKDIGRPIGILADLQGPKLRVGTFANGEGYELEEGELLPASTSTRRGRRTRVQLPHKEIFEALEPGAHLLVNDGKIRLRVNECGEDFADCTVVVGGPISNRKGVNVPDVVLPLAALSEKDRKDLEFVCSSAWTGWRCPSCSAPRMWKRRARWPAAAPRSCPRSRNPRRCRPSTRSSPSPTGSWWRAAILASNCRCRTCRRSRSGWCGKCRAAAKPVIVATQMLEA